MPRAKNTPLAERVRNPGNAVTRRRIGRRRAAQLAAGRTKQSPRSRRRTNALAALGDGADLRDQMTQVNADVAT